MTYDLFSDLTGIQNGAITYTYAYTAKHQLQSKTDPAGDFFNAAFKAYDAISQSVSSYFNSSSAPNGGFVLYPNKSNTNQMQSVYKK